ncbi:MAG: HAD family hydrolase [Anaerolineae bacterium]|nr:HAD family hydrolase [Anaerolineae bacterium]
MLKAVLFDLDDTLLGNHMDTFIPRYFALLGQYAEAYLPRDKFFKALKVAMQMMMANTDALLTNRDVFWQSFNELTGLDAEEMELFFDAFYRNEFLALESVVTRRETAVSLISLCQQKGCKVVIATNPMFPLPAVEARLRWAGLPVTEFDFDLVTSYENMHATKPHPAYYEEILARIEVAPDEVLMVGDDWENDVEPAAAVGCFTYWLPMNGETVPPDTSLVTKYGTLVELYDLIDSCWLTELAA